MTAFPVLPLFTDAFIADTTHLTAEETGAYLMLLMVAWRRPGCSLPDDDTSLARWARVSAKTWTRIRPRVMAFWSLGEDGEWTQSRLSQEQLRASQRASVARENGTRGGRPKSLKNNDPENPAGLQKETQEKASISISKDNPIVPKSKLDIEGPFREFRAAYPKRDGSQDWAKAKPRFAALIGKGIPPDRLIASAQAYRAEAVRKGNLGTSYVKQAATFLSGAWEEYGAPDAEPGNDPHPAAWPRNLPAPSLVKSTWLTGKWPRDAWGAEPGEQGSRVPVEIAAEWTAERVAGGEGAALSSGLRLVGAAEFPAKAAPTLTTSAHKIPRAVC